MTREQAGEVVAVLVAGFPQLVLEGESIDLFVNAIAKFDDAELARDVAHKIVETRDRFPALAELLNEYHGQRRRRAKTVDASSAEPIELVDPAEIRAFVAALKLRHCAPAPVLPAAPAGACEDCATVGSRFQSGPRALCQPCALARIRVGEKLAHELAQQAA